MFAHIVTEMVTVENGVAHQKLTEEQKKILSEVQTAQTAKVNTESARQMVKTMDIAAAINARANGGDPSDISGIYADSLRVTIAGEEQPHVYPCAVCKSANIATAKLTDATVWKVYVGCQMTHSDKALAAVNSIRDYNTGLFMQAAERKENVPDHIVKEMSLKDASLSTTLFPLDIRNAERFNKSLAAKKNLQDAMTAEFLVAIKGAEEAVKKTAYRNINKSYIETLFELEYRSKFGQDNDGNPADVIRHNDLLKKFRNKMSTVGYVFLSSDTITFGLNVRKMTISPTVIWKNEQKIEHVKQFGSGSYYVSSNIDTGSITIPTTPTIIAKYLEQIVQLMDHDMALLEAETAAEVGLTEVKVTIPELPTTEVYKGSRNYWELLGISEETEKAWLTELTDVAKEKAKEVIQELIDNKRSMQAEAIMDTLGGRR